MRPSLNFGDFVSPIPSWLFSSLHHCSFILLVSTLVHHFHGRHNDGNGQNTDGGHNNDGNGGRRHNDGGYDNDGNGRHDNGRHNDKGYGRYDNGRHNNDSDGR
jgi:hypothetical protein